MQKNKVGLENEFIGVDAPFKVGRHNSGTAGESWLLKRSCLPANGGFGLEICRIYFEGTLRDNALMIKFCVKKRLPNMRAS